jgi:hypothetical protein
VKKYLINTLEFGELNYQYLNRPKLDESAGEKFMISPAQILLKKQEQ